MKDFRTKAKEIEKQYDDMLKEAIDKEYKDMMAKQRAADYMSLKDGYKEKDAHYNNENGSLYLFAQQHELNAYEFDIIKRIVRCRKKGYFHEDLAKSIRVIELYLKEHVL
jgi:hypothetical protein